MENNMEVTQKGKNRYDPEIPLLGIYLKVRKSVCQRDICTSMFTVAPFKYVRNRKNLIIHQLRSGLINIMK
jgi:hypothetical protein